MPSIAVPEATTAPTFKSAHFIGVGGAGMSGIALVLHERGCRVTGSDLKTSRYIRQLTRAGVPIHVGHAASTIDEFQPDVVVVSTAIPETNPELVRARELGIPVWHRAKMLSALGYGRTTIACAGTHGKTTTSSMVATMLDRMELDPSFLIGGVVEGYGTNGKNGDGEYFVVEADESDSSFLYLDPHVVIVTNIEADHMDHYDSLEQIEETFCTFMGLVGEDGTVIVCGEDPRLVELARSCGRTVFTYGEGDGMDVRLNPAATRHAFGSDFTVTLCRIKVVRIISIHDKIDTDNKLFPDTTPAEVLAMFGALPEEVAVLRKSSDKIIRLQQSISIPITKKSMSKTERDKKIVDMYNNGYSIRDIWKESGVRSKSTVYSILNKYKVQLNRTPGRVPGIRK